MIDLTKGGGLGYMTVWPFWQWGGGEYDGLGRFFLCLSDAE